MLPCCNDSSLFKHLRGYTIDSLGVIIEGIRATSFIATTAAMLFIFPLVFYAISHNFPILPAPHDPFPTNSPAFLFASPKTPLTPSFAGGAPSLPTQSNHIKSAQILKLRPILSVHPKLTLLIPQIKRFLHRPLPFLPRQRLLARFRFLTRGGVVRCRSGATAEARGGSDAVHSVFDVGDDVCVAMAEGEEVLRGEDGHCFVLWLWLWLVRL